MKVNINGQGHMTKMATMAISSKNLLRPKKINVLFPETSKYFYGSVSRQLFF